MVIKVYDTKMGSQIKDCQFLKFYCLVKKKYIENICAITKEDNFNM